MLVSKLKIPNKNLSEKLSPSIKKTSQNPMSSFN